MLKQEKRFKLNMTKKDSYLQAIIRQPFTITKQNDAMSALAYYEIPFRYVKDIYICTNLIDIDPLVIYKPNPLELPQSYYLKLIRGAHNKLMNQIQHLYPTLKLGERILVDGFQAQISPIYDLRHFTGLKNAEIFASGSILDIFPNGRRN